MTITVQWEDAGQTILLYDFFGHWTADDLEARMNDAAAMMDTVDHPVRIFVNVREMSFIPALSAQVMRKVANAPTVRHPNYSGTIVVIGANTFIQMMFEVFTRLAPKAARHYHFVDTMAEAHAVLK